MVSVEDYEDLVRFNWVALWNEQLHGYYAMRGFRIDGEMRYEYMHRRILGLLPGDKREVDHIDSSATLDNRRSNLRIATRLQQQHNMRRHRDGASGLKGVTFDKRRNKWIAQIHNEGKHHNLGRFATKEAAHAAYCEAAARLYGEFARFA